MIYAFVETMFKLVESGWIKNWNNVFLDDNELIKKEKIRWIF